MSGKQQREQYVRFMYPYPSAIMDLTANGMLELLKDTPAIQFWVEGKRIDKTVLESMRADKHFYLVFSKPEKENYKGLNIRFNLTDKKDYANYLAKNWSVNHLTGYYFPKNNLGAN